jgi:hypothetical protein
VFRVVKTKVRKALNPRTGDPVNVKSPQDSPLQNQPKLEEVRLTKRAAYARAR